MNVKLIGINGRFSHSSLALFYVRYQLEFNCPFVEEIELFQFTINDSYYETLLNISGNDADVVFFSAYVWNSERICRLIRDLKRARPSCLIIIGGPQAEVVGYEVGCEECTFVVGEVEALGADFYSDLAKKKLRRSYGTLYPAKREFFPFPYRSSDYETYLENRNIYYESSRGCPFSCSYCLSSQDRVVFHKSVEEVKKELERVLVHEPKIIRFVDRTFNDVPERALAIWKFLADRGGKTTFHFEVSPRRFSKEIYDFLATVPPGRFQFEIGVQSTHRQTLESIQRRIDSGESCEVISRLTDLGNIHLHVDLILGLPFETRESFMRSFAEVFQTGAHYIQMGLLKILPDTPLYKSCPEYDYSYCGSPPYEVLATKWMNHQQIERLYWYGECVEKFMNNRYFPSVWRYLRSEGEDIACFFEKLADTCKVLLCFQLAPTQELLCRVLLKSVEVRIDRELFEELLRHDWLRCGHKFLPDCIQVCPEDEQPQDLKRKLFELLPDQKEGVYSRKNRNVFFKKSIFLHFSGRALKVLGYRDESCSGILCFMNEREKCLFQLNRTVLFETDEKD